MRSFVDKHSLGIILFTLFLASWIAQLITTAWHDTFKWSEFFKDTLENWQSEFLQVFIFVTFTKFFREEGSPESK
jgi:hypothetical protein